LAVLIKYTSTASATLRSTRIYE